MSAPLNSLTTGSYYALEWRQLKALSNDAELKLDDRQIGTLTFRSVWGTFATAQLGDVCWTFKRVGFFQNRVEVRACGSDAPVAEFVNATWQDGGTLTMKGGKQFKATSNLWKTKWEVSDEQGRQILRFDYGRSFKLAAKVKIASSARSLEELPLLVALSWYLVVMLSNDATASSAVIS